VDKTLFYGVSTPSILLLIVLGIVHTGIAYLLYFSSVGSLKSHTVAIFSYIDPSLAVILSFTVMQEGFSIPALIGAVLIIVSSVVSEVKFKNKTPQSPTNN
jgi:drug/metabolite transporter (DMT)-like permease